MNIRVQYATLLSIEEYLENLDAITTRNIWFWLRDACPEQQDLASAVYLDNQISFYECDYNFGVVPALILEEPNLTVGSKLTYGGLLFTVLRNGRALSDQKLVQYPFRQDWQAKNANVYSVSDVKCWIDKWFALNGNIVETIV